MAHHTTHRRNIAASDPNTSMDPTSKKHPNFTTITTTTKPHPDLAVDSSKLHTNHKPIVASSSLMKSTRQHRRKTAPKKSSKESHEEDDIKRALANIKTDDEIKESPSSKKEVSANQESEVMGFGEGCEKKMASVSLAMGRRRSFCDSQSELADFLICNGVKVVSADMPPFMQIHAVDFARKAYDSLEKFTAKTLAFSLKKEFDGVYGPAWHCIVGTSFGSFVTHSVGGFLYFSMDHKLYVLLFKTTVQRAD